MDALSFRVVAVTGLIPRPNSPNIHLRVISINPRKGAALVCAATVGCMRWMHRCLKSTIISGWHAPYFGTLLCSDFYRQPSSRRKPTPYELRRLHEKQSTTQLPELVVQHNCKWRTPGQVKKGKAIPITGLWGPEGFGRLRLQITRHSAYEGGKVVTLTHRPPLPPGISWYSLLEAESTPGHTEMSAVTE